MPPHVFLLHLFLFFFSLVFFFSRGTSGVVRQPEVAGAGREGAQGNRCDESQGRCGGPNGGRATGKGVGGTQTRDVPTGV